MCFCFLARPRCTRSPGDPTKKFFTNTKAGDVYDTAPMESKSLDYSLQLAVGRLA